MGTETAMNDLADANRPPAALARTPFYDSHVARGARMVDFAGWSMPVQYGSIVEEHEATRAAVGVFDISHMGRLSLSGAGSERFLDSVVTRRVTSMKPGRIRYALMTNEAGGILDDILVYARIDGQKSPYQIVVNAGNRDKIVKWLDQRMADWHSTHTEPVQWSDDTNETAMIAVQGPRAVELVEPLTELDVRSMKYYTGRTGRVGGIMALISRTGYTGEDGFEFILPAEQATEVWAAIVEAASALGGLPAGLGSRDTLRLEAAMPLYGHELSEQINPVQAGLDFAVDLEGRQFVGRDAIARFQNNSDQPVRVGLKLTGRRVPRQGYLVYHGDRTVGEVTSGTFSPTLKQPIAMGYVARGSAEVPSGQAGVPKLPWSIDIRGRREPAQVVPLPFYRRTS